MRNVNEPLASQEEEEEEEGAVPAGIQTGISRSSPFLRLLLPSSFIDPTRHSNFEVQNLLYMYLHIFHTNWNIV